MRLSAGKDIGYGATSARMSLDGGKTWSRTYGSIDEMRAAEDAKWREYHERNGTFDFANTKYAAIRDLQDLAATAMFEPDVYRGMCDDAQDVNAKLP